MKKIISVLISLLILSGCVPVKKEIEVLTKPIDFPILDISPPDPVKMNPVVWKVITENNYKEIFDKKNKSDEIIFFVALNEKSFKNLSLNNANILKFIRDQKAVIVAYKKYYEKNIQINQSNTDIKK